jgi:HEAT repeat protein
MTPAALALALAAALAGPGGVTGAASDEVHEDEQLLREAGLEPAGAFLLDFFRRRTPKPVERNRLEALARQLADRSPGVAETAAAELIGLGHSAVGALRPVALDYDDAMAAARARKCLDCIEGPAAATLVQAAARLVAVRRPAGAVPVLLAYLPFADNDVTLAEVEETLRKVGVRDGRPDPTLLQALNDPTPVRRGSAAGVLGQAGGPVARRALVPLLRDPCPTVRLKVARALVQAHEVTAVPVLIDLLAEPAPEARKQAETYLAELAGEWAVSGPGGDDPLSCRIRHEAWRAWWQQTDGASLLDEFRSRTLADSERQKVLAWIGHINDASPDTRARAMAALTALGACAVPLLRQAQARGDVRTAEAAQHLLQAIERDRPRPLPVAAARLLSLRRPEGTAEALIAYLPFAEDDAAAAEIIDVLGLVSCLDGKVGPALVKALTDPVPARRTGAAAALCKAGDPTCLPAVRRLLRDPDAEARLGTALALAARGDRDAVPVLIALLGELPAERSWPAQECLLRLASDKAPADGPEADRTGRQTLVSAWHRWWGEHGNSVDMARAREAEAGRGVYYVLEQQGTAGQGRFLVVSSAGRIRWQLDGLAWPWDAQLLPDGHLLVAEQNNRVSERGRDGKVLWSKSIPNALCCRRLPGGRTVVVARQQVSVFDRKGAEVFARPMAGDYVMAAEVFRDGQVAVFSWQGNYVRLDRHGKQVKTGHVPYDMNDGISGAAILPGDRVLVCTPAPGRVAEYGADGKRAWVTSLPGPGYPTRLPNGHILVPTRDNTALTELDRSGRIVRERKDLPYRPFRVYSP